MLLNRQQRKHLAASTLEVLRTGQVGDWDISECLDSSKQKTSSYPENHNISVQSLRPVKESTRTEIRVFNMTTIAAAKQLLLEETEDAVASVAALNFASAVNPGGGFLDGSVAQEESLAMNSGLYACLNGDLMYEHHWKNRNYGIYSDWAIFSPDVPVFRNEVDGSLLDAPWLCSIVSCPCINAGVAQKHMNLSKGQMRDLLEKRMRRMLIVLAAHHDGNVVLGAWGCGVFKNDPAVIASIFSELLQDKLFANRWPKIIFAVLDKENGRAIRAFESAFATWAS